MGTSIIFTQCMRIKTCKTGHLLGFDWNLFTIYWKEIPTAPKARLNAAIRTDVLSSDYNEEYSG